MDFGFGGNGGDKGGNQPAPNTNNTSVETTDLSGGTSTTDANGNPITNINDPNANGDNPGGKTNDGDGNVTTGKEGEQGADSNKEQGKTTEVLFNDLAVGSILEVGEEKYTVGANGDILKADGSVFKPVGEVKAWMDSMDVIPDEENQVSIATIQKTVGIELTDENNQPIVFDNTPEGVSAYVEAVLEAGRDEHYEQAVNNLFTEYPFMSDMINYYVANGKNLDGYNEVKDRSSVIIDDANESQHESIIRMAWSEQGRKGDVESYIAYLKSSGILLATAKDELSGLQESDKEAQEERATKAQEAENARIANNKQYWDGVKKTIDSKSIAGYTIPDNIIVSRNGQKISTTPNEFFKYLSEKDQNGQTAYQRERAAQDVKAKTEDDILRAYLQFTGGSYSNLVDMAINKTNVTKLRQTSQQRSNNSIKITKPAATPAKGGNIDLGY